MPGPARTNDVSILRRALIAYTKGGLAVNDGLTAAARAIARIPDRDIGEYTVRQPDPARNLKAYRKYWGDPRDNNGTTAHAVVERMLREALRRIEELQPATHEDVTRRALDDGIERLAADLEVLHHPGLLEISQCLQRLAPIGSRHAPEVRWALGLAKTVDRQLDGGLRATAPHLLRSIVEAAYRAGAIDDRSIPQLVLGSPRSVQPPEPPHVNSLPFGRQLAGDRATAEWLTQTLIRHHVTEGRDFNAAATSAESDLTQRHLPFVRDAAVPCGVRALLDLDRSAEAVEVYSRGGCDDLDGWLSSTSRIVRMLMVTNQQMPLVVATLQTVATMQIDDHIAGGREVSWLSQLHQPGGAIPEELVAYWAAGRDPDFQGEWSMLESAELLVWALSRQGRHASALEFARDTVRSAPGSALMPADEGRLGQLIRMTRIGRVQTQDAPDVDRALTQLYDALLKRPGPLPLRTVRDLKNLAGVLGMSPS